MTRVPGVCVSVYEYDEKKKYEEIRHLLFVDAIKQQASDASFLQDCLNID